MAQAAIAHNFKRYTDIPNITTVKDAIKQAYYSGLYEQDLATSAETIRQYLYKQRNVKQPALVLDVCDTAFSTLPYQISSHFCYNKKTFYHWLTSTTPLPLQAILILYRYAIDHGFTVFFITSIPESMRAVITKKLKDAGYMQWQELIMRPDDYQIPSIAPFKIAMRKKIEEAGYTIVANVGDQESDIAGGYALKHFKLPNPAYIEP